VKKKEFDYSFIDYSRLDELSGMFKACFNLTPPSDYFNWKFLRNPAGKAIGFVARHQNNVAGFYGIIPEYFVINEKKVLLYQSMDTMTHPDYQRQGLFATLGKMTLDHMIARHGEVSVIGFPGITSHSGFINKIGWKDVNLIPYLFQHKTMQRLRHPFLKQKLQFEKIKSFDASFESYFKKKKYPAGKLSNYIDSAFLNWRIADNAVFKYEIVKISSEKEIIGFVIYKMDEKQRCFIHYLDFNNEEQYVKFLPLVCDYLYQEVNTAFIYTF
jgi:hypothetical protein